MSDSNDQRHPPSRIGGDSDDAKPAVAVAKAHLSDDQSLKLKSPLKSSGSTKTATSTKQQPVQHHQVINIDDVPDVPVKTTLEKPPKKARVVKKSRVPGQLKVVASKTLKQPPTTPSPPRKCMRVFSPAKLTASPKSKNGNVVLYTAMAQEGVAVAWIATQHREHQAAYIYPINLWFRDHQEDQAKCHIYKIMDRRNPDAEDGALPFRPGDPYPYQQFVRIVDPPGALTTQLMASWRKQLVPKFHAMMQVKKGEAKNGEVDYGFNYLKNCIDGGDRTVYEIDPINLGNKKLPPVAKYLLNKDVMEIIDLLYSNNTREEQAEELTRAFFGDAEEQIKFGVDFIRNYPPTF